MIFNHKAKIAGGAWTKRMETHVVPAQQVRTGKGYVYSGQMTSVSAVLFPRACARACERARACVRVRMIQQPEQRWCVGHSHSSGAITEPNTQTADFYSRRDLQRIVLKTKKKKRAGGGGGG